MSVVGGPARDCGYSRLFSLRYFFSVFERYSFCGVCSRSMNTKNTVVLIPYPFLVDYNLKIFLE